MLRFDCVSNSSQSGVGSITLSKETSRSFWTILYPYNRPGLVRLVSSATMIRSHQGVYTCNIPDTNNKMISINVGLYPRGFTGDNYYILFPGDD